MIPNHLALVPWHPYQQAAWQAIAQVEARREAGRRLPAYPYATAFFRQLTGRPTLSAKDIRMIDVTYRPGDRRSNTRKEDYLDALDSLIASRGEHCYSPLPGDTRDRLFPVVSRRRRQRFEHRLTMKHTRQARIDDTIRRHKRRRYQVRLAQAEIELAFVTPGTLDSWVRRAQQQGLTEDDLSGLVLAWTTRFPCLAELDRYLWAAMPFWEACLQVSLISRDLSAADRADNDVRLPNRLVHR
ncbi:plasmid SOS inhibition protein A [Serratia bockelmannii]|uniref:Plasmid SOS inhibition protein A n=1 Tax=Serratia bockelmannii TaxID=2703793 RepID=A0ABT8LZN9_9GAMM|nr:plasmid SOS inhibition protein A [Serratia bockelmannii]MDN6881830.1 plasmid SOS inhibition protein A [Serratia bockelmannii]HBH6890295.1 plasmid SOS inhibition protein A [Serratia marcescens]